MIEQSDPSDPPFVPLRPPLICLSQKRFEGVVANGSAKWGRRGLTWGSNTQDAFALRASNSLAAVRSENLAALDSAIATPQEELTEANAEDKDPPQFHTEWHEFFILLKGMKFCLCCLRLWTTARPRVLDFVDAFLSNFFQTVVDYALLSSILCLNLKSTAYRR